MKRLGVILLVLLAVAIVYLLAWPVPIDPVAWTPPAAPTLEGPYAANAKLKDAERLAAGQGVGPEALALDAEGRVYTGYADGRVMRFDADGKNGQLLANTGGRPLGLKFAPDGRLIVADAVKGLVAVGEGKIDVLATEAEGKRFGFTDDLDITKDGVVYFSDASWKFGIHQVMEDVLEHGANGRLVRYDLKTGKCDVVARDLHFPNGVAIGPDEAFLVFNETTTYRVMRYGLKGEKAGTVEPFIENLPGLPDNVTFDPAGQRFWVALYAPRTKDLDNLLPNPFLRKVVDRLPSAAQPAPVLHGFVIALDPGGKVVANLQDATSGAYAPITSAIAHGPWLYLGSLLAPSFARVPLAAAQ